MCHMDRSTYLATSLSVSVGLAADRSMYWRACRTRPAADRVEEASDSTKGSLRAGSRPGGRFREGSCTVMIHRPGWLTREHARSNSVQRRSGDAAQPPVGLATLRGMWRSTGPGSVLKHVIPRLQLCGCLEDDGSGVAEILVLGGCYALMDTRQAASAELGQVFALIAREHQDRRLALPKDTTEIVHA